MKTITPIFLSTLFLIALALQNLNPLAPKTIESIYSNGVNLWFRQLQGLIFGVFPFSVAEVLILLAVAAIALWLLYLISQLFTLRKKGLKPFISKLLISLLIPMTLYSAFVFFWGLNYQRPSILPTESTVTDTGKLENLCLLLVEKVNRERTQLDGASLYQKPNADQWKKLQEDMAALYHKAALKYPSLRGTYSKPKPIYFSVPFSYTGIVGIYFPFTGEANVNMNEVPFYLPSTAAHEMAHQRGYAKEEEANFIAYLILQETDNPNYQYSGSLLALVQSSNRLYEDSPEAYSRVRDHFSKALIDDLNFARTYWKPYRGKIEEQSSQINDNYLKSNGQVEGIRSYSLMIKLLLTYYDDQL